MLRACIFAVLAACVAIAASCSREPASSAGTTGASDTDAPRIAALSPAVAIMLRDLGHADDIVARHAYDYVLPAEIPAAGDQAGIDYEALIRAAPTHVFTQWGAREVPGRLTELAAQRGWTLRDVNPLSLEDIAQATLTLDGALHGEPRGMANELAASVRALAALPASSSGNPLRVLLLVGLSPATALGPGSCHHEMLLSAGARAAVEQGLAFQDLTNEDLVRLAPDAIIWFRPRSPRAMNPTGESGGREGNAGAADPWEPVRGLRLGAVEGGRVAIIDDPLGLMPSTAMIGVGKRMRELVEGWGTVERKLGER
jgi:ABC-type hemin transport system substrate-binding protein